ncbi:MAG: glycosyltransferase [Lachnospiraceae bacterium]|nr:glycosyltransferase [Lachnospiraceae bacterium]
MKISVVFDGLGTGGIERVGADYIKLLLQLGHEVTIYNLKPEKKEMEHFYPTECEIIHKSLPELLLSDRYILMVKRWGWGKYLYPIIYPVTRLGMYLYRLTMGRRKSYDIAIAFSGHFRDLNFVTANYIRSRKRLCWLHGALMEYLVSASTYGDQYRKIRNLCVLSEANQDAALYMNRYLYGLNIRHIYNPIDLEGMPADRAHVKCLEEEYGEFILSVGRFEEDKDQDTILKAVAILKREYGITNKMIFLGEGERLMYCRQLSRELGIEDLTVFLGNRSDVGDFYTAATLFVHSSPAEGLPTVLLEAMKYGVPIVATRSMPGVEEILQGDQYGVQCKVGDPEDMAKKLWKCLRDEDLRRCYCERGIQRVKDFSFDSIRVQLEKILEGLA